MLLRIFTAATIFAVLCGSATLAAKPTLKFLAFYSTNVESDHVKTANDAIAFYRDLAAKNNFVFDVTRDMEHGGGWIGFHVAGYNVKDTYWPWFVNFLGCAVFYSNNWPPLPAKLMVDDPNSPVTKSLPASFHLCLRRTNGIYGSRAHA